MGSLLATTLEGAARLHTSTRSEGDFAIDADPAELAQRRRVVADHPWVWLRQVHGAEVVTVGAGQAAAMAGAEGDALVTAELGVVLSVQTADCVPVALAAERGRVGLAHAGWRGLEAGVIGATVAALSDLAALSDPAPTEVAAATSGGVVHVGPHIGPCCYEFGSDDLDRLADRFGPSVRAATRAGTPALDLTAAVAGALDAAGATTAAGWRRRVATGCTSCDPARWFSYRARAERQRMATALWLDPVLAPSAGTSTPWTSTRWTSTTAPSASWTAARERRSVGALGRAVAERLAAVRARSPGRGATPSGSPCWR